MKKLKFKEIEKKYIIVVDGDEEKVVYNVDDSSIFSVHVTGVGRGARNASLSNNTFKSLSEVDEDIKYLENSWTLKFKAIRLDDYEKVSPKGYKNLIMDIEEYALEYSFEKQYQKKLKMERFIELGEDKKRAIELINAAISISVHENEDEAIIDLQK
jgi:hypothetical protein